MKLKDRPLDWWKGKKFTYWCRADANDDRRINYTMEHYSIGQGHVTKHFTSDDIVDILTLHSVQHGVINSIELKGNEWFVSLNCGYMGR